MGEILNVPPSSRKPSMMGGGYQVESTNSKRVGSNLTTTDQKQPRGIQLGRKKIDIPSAESELAGTAGWCRVRLGQRCLCVC